MKKSIWCGIVAVIAVVQAAGCAPLILGAAVGAVGGYAVSRDTIQGESDKPYEEIWDSVRTVARIRGAIVQMDAKAGYIRMNVDSSRVDINVERMDTQTTRIKLTARRYGFPNLPLAQDLYVKILEGLQSDKKAQKDFSSQTPEFM
jgi:hypothetical protein